MADDQTYHRVNEALADSYTTYVQTQDAGARDLYTIGALSSAPVEVAAVHVVTFAEREG